MAARADEFFLVGLELELLGGNQRLFRRDVDAGVLDFNYDGVLTYEPDVGQTQLDGGSHEV